MSAADRNQSPEDDADVLVVSPPTQDDTTALLFDDGTLLEQLFCEWAAGSDDLEALCRSVQSATPTSPSPLPPPPSPLPPPPPSPSPSPALASQALTPPSSPSAPRAQSPSTPPPVLLLTPPSTPPTTTAHPASYEDLLCTEPMPASPLLRTFPRFRGAASLQPPQPRYRAWPYPEPRSHRPVKARPTRAVRPTTPQHRGPTGQPPGHKPPTLPTPPPEEEPTTRVWLVKRTTTRRVVTYRRCADDTVLVTCHPTASVVHYTKVVSRRTDK